MSAPPPLAKFFDMGKNIENLKAFALQLKAIQNTLETLIRDEKNEPFFNELVEFSNEVTERFDLLARMIGFAVIDQK